MKKGDTVRTPRFLTVTIKEVYESREDATRDGFTEPTHYTNDSQYDVLGKSIGINRMIFAAVPKYK